MEMQVLSGILPISQVPAIPSCIYHALLHLPLEQVFGLQHPAETAQQPEDKRTWRGGARPARLLAKQEVQWTAMDVLSAFAELKGWITAKAGRPDVNRAGNAMLRTLAEGRIKWAFYPPGTNEESLPTWKGLEGNGIWITHDDDDYDSEMLLADDDNLSDQDGSDQSASSDDSDEGDEDDIEEEEDENVTAGNTSLKPRSGGTGMFSALTLDDEDPAEEDSDDSGGSEPVAN